MLMSPPLLYLSADAVYRALPMREAIDAMRDAFALLARGEVTLPPRLRLDAPAEYGAALVMPCHCTSYRLFSTKVVTVFDRNVERGLPAVQSILILTDGSTGAPLAVMDGASLTAIRTGAASGLATDLLARPDAASVAVIGAGVQARTQLEAVCCVRAVRRRGSMISARKPPSDSPTRCSSGLALASNPPRRRPRRWQTLPSSVRQRLRQSPFSRIVTCRPERISTP